MRLVLASILSLVAASQASALVILSPICEEADGTRWEIEYRLAADQYLASRYHDEQEELRLVLCNVDAPSLSVFSSDQPDVDARLLIVAAVLSDEIVPLPALRDRLRIEGFRARSISYPRNGCVCDAEGALIDLTDPHDRSHWSEIVAQRLPEGAF